MEPLAKNKGGTLNWINNYDDKRIEAFFGSRREYEEIGEKLPTIEVESVCLNPWKKEI